MTQNDLKNKLKEKQDNKDAIVKPDPETLHTTDPQDHMQGPISSLVQKTRETVQEQGGKVNKEDEEEEA
jgi:hypothetical protein